MCKDRYFISDIQKDINWENDVADAMGVSVDQEQTAAEIPTV